MINHEEEDLVSVASIEGQEEESRQRNNIWAEPDESWFLPNDQISYKAEERGLCSVCSQYDWRWHLRPDQNAIPTSDALSTQADLEQRSLVTGEKFYDDIDEISYIGVPTTRAPYPGRYGLKNSGIETGRYGLENSGIQTQIQLSPFPTMLKTRVYCALCDLIVRATGSILHGKELEKLQKISEPLKLTCTGNTGLEFWWAGLIVNGSVIPIRFDLLSEVTQPFPKYGRITHSDQADLQILKQIWTTCQRDHLDCAFKPPQFEALSHTTNADRKLRVIDVKQARVISAPSGCRY